MTQKLKTFIFVLIEPIFPYVRDLLLFCKIIHHTGRQKFPIGFLNKKITPREFAAYLVQLGFRRNLIAWKDDGEILGMRKLEGFDFCYHVRLFADGEIRGHFERTVESNPIKHFFERGMEQRAEQFRRLVGPMLEQVEEYQRSVATVSR